VKQPEVFSALEAVRGANPDGLLVPEEVVLAAREPESPLHDEFEWDDGVASHKYRLWEARKLIARVMIERPDRAGMPAYVSVSIDRIDRGGYRRTDLVMSDEGLREAMLKTAMQELRAFRARYSRFVELSKIFVAIAEVEDQVGASPENSDSQAVSAQSE